MPEVENFLDFEMCSKMNFSLEYYLSIIIGEKICDNDQKYLWNKIRFYICHDLKNSKFIHLDKHLGISLVTLSINQNIATLSKNIKNFIFHRI